MTEIEPDWHFGQNIDLTSSSMAFGGENNHGPEKYSSNPVSAAFSTG
jgi:hypothetical protein